MAYASISLSTLRQRLQEKYDDVPFWTDTEADRAVNESLREWNLLTGTWKRRITLQTIPNDPYLPIPGTLTYASHVEYESKPLSPCGLEAMDMGRPAWESELTTSTGLPSAPRIWIPISLDLIAFWPTDAAGHHTITIDGVAETPVLAVDADLLDLGEEDINTILGYALHTLSFKSAAIFRTTLDLYKSFLTAAGERNDRLQLTAFYRQALGLTPLVATLHGNRDLQPRRSE